eukprot:7590363-Pyramimonas_sp.AAC.1
MEHIGSGLPTLPTDSLDVKVFVTRTGYLYETAMDAKLSILVLMWVVGAIMTNCLETPAANWLLKYTPSSEKTSKTSKPLQGLPQRGLDADSASALAAQPSESESVPLVQRVVNG